LWTRRSYELAQPARALARARALREGLLGAGWEEPVVLLLVQTHFGAEEEDVAPGVVPGLRGLFVDVGGRWAGGRPAWASRCERFAALPAAERARVGVVLGELLA